MIRIVLLGKPVGKPRMTQRDKWKKRPCVMKYRAFADALRLAAIESGGVPDASDVQSLSWVATFAFPKSYTKKRRAELIGQLHRVKPDRDNIDKAILDALFKQDSAIAAGTIEKRWGDENKLEITIEVNGCQD